MAVLGAAEKLLLFVLINTNVAENMEMPKQFDNLNSKVIDDLKITLRRSSKVSIAAASFSIYAYEALREGLEAIDELRFIFTSPTFSKERASKEKREFFIPKLSRERNLFGSDFEIKLRNQLSQKAIARECADRIRRKACFKTNTSNGVLNGNMTVVSRLAPTPCSTSTHGPVAWATPVSATM